MEHILEIALFTFFMSTGFCIFLTYHLFSLRQGKKTVFVNLPKSLYFGAAIMEGIALLLLDFACDGLIAKLVAVYTPAFANLALAMYIVLFDQIYTVMLSPKHYTVKMKGKNGKNPTLVTNGSAMRYVIYGIAGWLLWNSYVLAAAINQWPTQF